MAKRTLLIATRSTGKLSEILSMLRDLTLELIGLHDVADLPPGYRVEEPAMTFEGNAIIKAMTLGHKTRLLTLAEDAGLEVDALGGLPGVHTARYAPGTDTDRYMKLLEALKEVPDGQRTARFRAVVCMYDPITDKVRTCEGVCEGRIVREPRGVQGFGYDPVFYNPAFRKTLAEMTLEEKNAISHRGAALKKAREVLRDTFLSGVL